MIQRMIHDIRSALESKLYAVALVSALTLPDICAATESEDGLASKERYTAWLEKWFIGYDKFLNSEDIYQIRCKVLHQGEVEYTNARRRPVRWLLPVAGEEQRFFPDDLADFGDRRIGVTLDFFCEFMCRAAEDWWRAT